MVHFAEIDPTTNIVKRIIVCESKEWCEKTFGGTWIKTYYRTEGTNFAGIGWTYHPDKDNFSSPQPYPSWTLDDQCNWQPPVARPVGEGPYTWNEETQSWESNL
jgi:hypothetical protein